MSGGSRVEDGDGLLAVADGDDLDVLVGERQLDDALNRDAVVGEQQGMRHVWCLSVSRSAALARLR